MMEKGEMMHKKMHAMGKIAKCLVVIGGLNWGLIGIGGFMGKDLNVVHMVLGNLPKIEWIVYILVGLAALKMVFHRYKMMKGCCGDCNNCMSCDIDKGGMKMDKPM